MVTRLEYEAFEALAVKEGERIVEEARQRFPILQAACVHRVGSLDIGELAVWVGVSAQHRDEAFAACRYIIDEVKHRVPIWKKEHYLNGDSGWVNCERCATPRALKPACAGPTTRARSRSRKSAPPARPDCGRAACWSLARVAGCARALVSRGRGRRNDRHRGWRCAGSEQSASPAALRPGGCRQTQGPARSRARCARSTRESTATSTPSASSARTLARSSSSTTSRSIAATISPPSSCSTTPACWRASPAIFASVYQYEGQLQSLSSGRRERLPALPVARSEPRRDRRQLRRGRRAGPSAGCVREPAGGRGTQDPARSARPTAQRAAHH